jgi:hypothetical protein
VQSFAIVEHLDVLEDRLPGLLVRRVLLLMDQFKRYPDLRPNACQDVQKKTAGSDVAPEASWLSEVGLASGQRRSSGRASSCRVLSVIQLQFLVKFRMPFL